jgi:hypothetical protein
VLGNPQAPDMHVLMPKNGNIQRFSANQNTRKPKISDTSFQLIRHLLDANRRFCRCFSVDGFPGAMPGRLASVGRPPDCGHPTRVASKFRLVTDKDAQPLDKVT